MSHFSATTLPAVGARPAATGPLYRLMPGLRRLPHPAGGAVLTSRRPLMAMRLNPQATAIVTALEESGEGTSAEAVARLAGVAPSTARAFLDRLAGRRLVERIPLPPQRWPEVSIIVAARGRPEATRECVRSLLALDYPADLLEIIVVDDASASPLADVLSGLPVRLIRLASNVGQSAARNLGAAEAEGELLAFTDNDCTAEPGWLRALVPHFTDPEVVLVGGRVVAAPADGPVAAFEAARSPLDMGAQSGPVGPEAAVGYLPTCNLLVRRDALLAAGGFTVAMRVGEDVDFCMRVLQRGGRAVYATEGRIVHDHRVRLADLLRRRADYGASEADLQRRHAAQRRTMPLPTCGLLALATLSAATVFWPLALLLSLTGVVLLAREMHGKHRRLRNLGMPATRARVAAAVLREHRASLHTLSANALRYYSLPLAAAAIVLPPLLPAVAILLLLAPVIDHRRLRPALSLPVFVSFTVLELLAYQGGVWRGCRQHRTLEPMLPRLVRRR